MKRRFLIVVSVLAVLSFFTASALSAEFWASKNSDKYHYPTCGWAQKILPGNLVKFKGPEEAIKAGYKPCKVCKPPTASKSETPVQIQTANAAEAKDIQKKGLLLELWRCLGLR